MPVTFEKLVRHVRERAEHELTPAIARSDDPSDKAVIEKLVLYTINGAGLYVSTKPDGNGEHEVYSPEPQPTVNFPDVTQRNVHYLGQKRGRYGR